MSGIATAIVGSAVIGGTMSSRAAKKSAKTAASAELESTQMSIDEQRRQFDKIQELLSPFIQSGTTALSQQQALIGLGGADAQQVAIEQLQRSPQFEALVSQGEEGILQNAAATGGLRGGNIQASLSQFRPAMLSNLIESQYSKLGNLTQIGQASATGQAVAGQNASNAIQQALMAGGEARAQSALASGAATAKMWGDIAGSVGTVAGMSKGSFGKF